MNILKSMLTRSDFENKLQKLSQCSESQRPSICASLCNMFSALDIKCEKDREFAYYDELVRNSTFPTIDDIEMQIMETMFSNFESYPTPQEYMSRIVRRLSDPDDNWYDDSLRLQILKRFIKYCNSLSFESNGQTVRVYNGYSYIKKYAKEKKGSSIKKGESLVDYIDDGIFDILSDAKKEQLKPKGTYGILKLADDLAQGKFKSGGATKQDLYMFAIAFEMSFSIVGNAGSLETDLIFDYESDIQKNLFDDYYSNNLMRFITNAYEGNLSAFEMDPSGQGINYKNFAEIVYIYFISKSVEEYTPTEKLQRAVEMIERLKLRDSKTALHMTDTQYFKRIIYVDDILDLSEDAFEDYIAEHYDCNVNFEFTDKDGHKQFGKKGELQIQTSQNTAFRCYNHLIETMEKGMPRENCNYGLYFVDVSMNEKISISELYANDFAKDKDPEKLRKFIKLLYGINMFMGHTFVENESSASLDQEHAEPSRITIKKMNIDNPENMTRTALVIAYYYSYNYKYEGRDIHKSFIDVFDDYTDPVSGLNMYLELSGYQTINEKNIFDMAVILSSYAYLNI